MAIEKTLAHPQKVLLVCLPYLTNIIEKYCKANDISVDYIYRPTGQKITKNTLYVLHMVPRLS